MGNPNMHTEFRQSINQSINFICQSQERLEAKELTIRSWNSRSQEQEHNDI